MQPPNTGPIADKVRPFEFLLIAPPPSSPLLLLLPYRQLLPPHFLQDGVLHTQMRIRGREEGDSDSDGDKRTCDKALSRLLSGMKENVYGRVGGTSKKDKKIDR